VDSKPKWKIEYELEIQHAFSARANGNEGKARVCARRAAGVIIGEYLSRRGYKRLYPSAYERLSLFNSLPDVDEHIKVITNHFLLKVDLERKLPVDIDLIDEAQSMLKILLLENTN